MSKYRRAKIPSSAQSSTKPQPIALVTEDNYQKYTIDDGESYSNKGDYNRKTHVWRILFETVPPVKFSRVGGITKLKRPETEYKPERTGFMVSVYNWLKTHKNPSTAMTYMGAIRYFVNFCEDNDLPVETSKEVIKKFSKHLLYQSKQPNAKLGTLQIYSSYLNLYIIWKGDDEVAKELIVISKKRDLTPSTEGYEPDEIKSLAVDLFNVYNKLSLAYVKGKKPECPFDKAVANWDSHPTHNTTAWLVKLVCAAYLITEMFTGDNSTPLLSLKRENIDLRDIKFDDLNNIYRITTRKGRSRHSPKEYELGFTKRGKDFFSTYIAISKKLDPSPDAFLFPNIVHGEPNGRIKDSNVSTFCNWFKTRMTGTTYPVPRRFRKTKGETIMGLTNCYATVAEALNNNIDTVERSYSDGTPTINDLSLASGAEAIIINAQGNSIEETRTQVTNKYGKIISTYEIQASDIRVSNTDIGSKCKEPFGDKAKRLKTELVKNGLANENDNVACFKFLDCFGCEHQAIVAELDDIWCLLSFRDSILEAISNPSINHTLSQKSQEVLINLQDALAELKSKYPEIYEEAETKNNQSPHPIWNDDLAVQDLYTIW
ncbi:hypothetical protein LZT04_00870 [Vibrio fluvialis]|nr:hypothetical protein [Vibrio fluvialis]